jgi:glycosyltransferase involved in cell wall biosynthesis
VSIGVPVYNGERYLRQALDSHLGQTYQDLELIICDNASTDGTERICREYAQRDRRVRYFRHPQNLGAGPNNNRVCELATGEYFKWAAHDDYIAADYLEKCVAILDSDSSVVEVQSRVRIVDENGGHVEDYDRVLRTDAYEAHRRFRELAWYDHKCFHIFGLMRSEALRRTPLLGYYCNGDGLLLARLALMGRFYEIPEYLFFSRRHQKQSANTMPDRLTEQRTRYLKVPGTLPAADWWHPKYKGKIVFPDFRQFWEYLTSIWNAPAGPVDKTLCYLYMGPWLGKHAPRMALDLVVAADQFFSRYLPPAKVQSRERSAVETD